MLPHTGGEHFKGRLVFFEALGEHPAQVELVQPPLRRRCERFHAVAVPGVSLVNAAAQLRAAPAVEVVQYRLADELSLQPDGEVHRQMVFKVPPGNVKEAPLLHRAPQARHVVIAPPAVPFLVQHQGVVGGNVLFRQGGESQPGRFHLGDFRDMAHQFVHGLKTVFGGQLGGAILELGGAQALVRRVVLPVNPLAVSAKGQSKPLHKGGIHPCVGVQGLFNVNNQRVPAALRQGQGNELVPVKHPSGGEPGLSRQLQHLLRQLQLVQGLGVVPLGKLRLVILPELFHGGGALRRQGTDLRLRPLGPEFLNVVSLAGVAPPGEILEVFPVIHVIPPGADIADPDIGVAA